MIHELDIGFFLKEHDDATILLHRGVISSMLLGENVWWRITNRYHFLEPCSLGDILG